MARIGVQGLLISVGALMVAVAGIVFLVVAWDRLGLSGRALVIATLTVAAMAAAVRLRPKLPETAEGIGAIASVLVLADAWAVRATGLWSTDRWHWSGYLALAGGLCTVLLYAWGRRFGVRAGSITAAAAGPASLVTAGLWLGSHHGIGGSFGAGLGLSAAAAAGLLRHRVSPTWRIERFLLLTAAVGGWGLAALTTLVADAYGWRQSVVLALAAIGAAAQARFTRTPRPGPTTGSPSVDHLTTPRALWAMGAGASAAAAVSPLPLTQLSVATDRLTAGAAVTWYPLSAPAAAAIVAAAIAWSTRPGRLLHRLARLPHRPTTAAARLVAVALTMPALLTVTGLGGGAVVAGFDAWHAGATDRLDHVIDPLAIENLWFHGDPGLLPLAAGLGLLVLAVLLEVGVRLGAAHGSTGRGTGRSTGRGTGPDAAVDARWSAAAVLAAGAGALPLALQPRWPVWLAVLVLLLVAAGFGFAAAVPVRGPRLGGWQRRAAVAVAAVLGTFAVLLSWSASPLSVPATLVGVAALLGARRAAPATVRPVLMAPAALATVVAAGGLAHYWSDDPAVRFRTASVAASLLTGLFAALPPVAATGMPARLVTWLGDRAERLTGAGVSWSAACLTALLGVVSGHAGLSVFPDSSRAQGLGPGDVAVAAALLAVALVVARARPGEAPAGPPAPIAAAAMVAPAAVALSLSVVHTVMLRPAGSVAPDRLGEASYLAAAAGVALVGLAVGLLGARGWRDARRLPAEIGLAVPLGLLAMIMVTDTGRYPTTWVVLLLLGVAATAAAIPADRHQVAWAGWVLLSTSSVVRLLRSDVGLVEAYTLPPALALLAVSAFRLRRDRSTQAWSTLAPGLGLAVLPSVLASGDGSVARPIVLIAAGALAVAGVWARAGWMTTGGRRLDLLAMAAAVTAAGGAATARTLAAAGQEGWPTLARLEAWTVPASLVVGAAGLQLLTRRSSLGSLWPTAPGLVLLLAPSVLAVLDGQPLWRVVWVSVAAAAVLVAGVVRRLRGPVLIGAAALTVHAMAQLGPWVVRTVADMPRWLSLAVVGVVVIGLGATYERRLRELKAVRLSLSGLR